MARAGKTSRVSADSGGTLLSRTRALIPSLIPSDARVARTIIEAPDAVIHQSVTEFATSAGVSTATVIRCAKKLGLKGFHDLKLTLAQELAAFRPPVAEEGESVLGRVIAASTATVQEAGQLVPLATFTSAVDTVAGARRVLVLGIGTSAPLAQDAAYRFRAVGLDAEAPADAHVQHVAAGLLRAEDVCLAFSHSGATRETLGAVEAGRRAGAKVVVITSFLRSPLAELADVVLTAGSRETAFHLEAVASRLAHLVLLDALVVGVAEKDPARSERALDLYADVLSDHRL